MIPNPGERYNIFRGEQGRSAAGGERLCRSGPLRGDGQSPLEMGITGPWGFWATIVFTLIVFVVYFSSQVLAISGFVYLSKTQHPAINIGYLYQSLPFNGFCLSVALIVSSSVCIALTLWLAMQRPGFPLKDYFCLNLPTGRALTRWLILMGVLIVSYDTLSHWLNRSIVPQFLVTIYQTASSLPLLVLAILIVAPLSEEILFRGFLLQGIRCSRLGSPGAVLLSAIGWSILHVQYDVYDIVHVFIVGLVLGMARVQTNSLYVTLAMHGLNNLVATIEAAALVTYFH